MIIAIIIIILIITMKMKISIFKSNNNIYNDYENMLFIIRIIKISR